MKGSIDLAPAVRLTPCNILRTTPRRGRLLSATSRGKIWELFSRLQVLDLSHNRVSSDEVCGLLVASLARGAFEAAEAGAGDGVARVAAAIAGLGMEKSDDKLSSSSPSSWPLRVLDLSFNRLRCVTCTSAALALASKTVAGSRRASLPRRSSLSSAVPPFASTLQLLVLRHNRIASLEGLSLLKGLRRLDLAHNVGLGVVRGA